MLRGRGLRRSPQGCALSPPPGWPPGLALAAAPPQPASWPSHNPKDTTGMTARAGRLSCTRPWAEPPRFPRGGGIWALRQKCRLQGLGRGRGQPFVGSNFEGKGTVYGMNRPPDVSPVEDRTQLRSRTGMATRGNAPLPSFSGSRSGQPNASGSWEVPGAPQPGIAPHPFHVFLPTGKAGITAGGTAAVLQP